MKEHVKEVRVFFYSQQLADGLRITLAVLLPALLLSYFHEFFAGLTISVGALCVSLVDTPGPIVHRRNSMLFTIFFLFVVSVITGFARLSIFAMGMEVATFSFFFSMFTVYGMRAASVGTAALLIMVLNMDNPVPPTEVLLHGLLIVSGGFWYLVISMIAYRVRPYRIAQRALGECLREIAKYLQIKAEFYDVSTDLEEGYNKLMTQQIVVSEKQDAVRELLFKTRQIVNESTATGRKLVMAFVDGVDLFEDATATYYNYSVLRNKFAESGILDSFSSTIKRLAFELDQIGTAIQTNQHHQITVNYDSELKQLKSQVDQTTAVAGEENRIVLKKILVNLRRIMQRNTDIMRYFDTDQQQDSSHRGRNDHSLFVEHQSLDPKIFWNNLNLHSSVFRHSLRVCFACIIGFSVAKFIAPSHHSYWIVMTIIFMVKPAFSLTKQRNMERVSGTLIGGVIGGLILLLIKNEAALFTIMLLFMISTYTFQRVRYFITVVSMTPFIIILFHFLGIGFQELIRERIVDTLIGCLIAVISSYVLLPNWEREQLNTYLAKVLEANKNYFLKVSEALAGKGIRLTDYKLARKQVYVNMANLSSALQRMISEPKSKQKNKKEIHQFAVLNHVLFSNVATVASIVLPKKAAYPQELARSANKTLHALCNSLKLLNEDCEVPSATLEADHGDAISNSPDARLLKEQLEFIFRLSRDIEKVSAAITSAKTTQ